MWEVLFQSEMHCLHKLFDEIILYGCAVLYVKEHCMSILRTWDNGESNVWSKANVH